ncbi:MULTISPECIES: putative phage abortive infection protein [unclassified Pseudovibrio]|uniref:putative phage abortive infection protein n=1 Tax=unclassified Pseudovibrio TaxID=2627060 RepID=UPI0007AE82B7|nr:MULTISPECIES: putative phage abortive infection protein [unclassified Pseudovibrio]KZL02722.1 hypothetical protein PsW74_01236 [Pseudovibrio sp. W74]KZL12391.1 hypothetical protein PsAD14_00562 [Pseudovibrio sp. Ad14]
MQILISFALIAFGGVLVFSALQQISKKEGTERINRLALLGFLGVLVLFVLHALSVYSNWWGVTEDLAKTLGPFGDSFGPLTSLFSALAFAALIWTVFLQREELQLSRKELALTRQEMADQRFESMLMRMLEVHTSLVADMDVDVNGSNAASRKDCFKIFLLHKLLPKKYGIYEEEKNQTGTTSSDFRIYQSGSETDRISIGSDTFTMRAYDQMYIENRSDLGHYFRSLYNILRFISESSRPDIFEYARIIRAQLSDFELAIICLNCLSDNGTKLKPLVEEFSILDNLPKDLYLSKSLMDQFDPKALQTPEQQV